MKVRTFLIENSAGEKLDLSASPDLFAFNPEGLGISIDNDLVSSGGSFLVNNRDIVPGEIKISLLLGALESNPYRMYDQLIRILSSPPYNLIYTTEVGSWRRSCIIKEISKTEINSFNVMTEMLVFECTTPWFNYVMNEYPIPPTQMGDGKIHSKHTNWKYADDGYLEPPLSGYYRNDFWKYNPAKLFSGKNMAMNMYYDELVLEGNVNNTGIFTINEPTPPGYNQWYVFEADIEVIGEGSFNIFFRKSKAQSTANRTLNPGIQHIRISAKQPIMNDDIMIEGSTGNVKVIIRNSYITYGVDGISLVNRFSKPAYWLSENKNLLGDQINEPYSIYTASDGISDTRYIYNVVPSNYPMIYDYIYNAEYTYDHRFSLWIVNVDTISLDAVTVKPGNVIDYTAHISNPRSSEDSISTRMIFLNGSQQIGKQESSYKIAPGMGDVVKFKGVTIPSDTTHIMIQVYKASSSKVVTIGCRFGAKRLYIEDLSEVLLTATVSNTKMVESDWVLADNPNKVVDSVHYGYIYDYVYDSDEKAANTYLIENNSLYLRSTVNSPCEVTIYGPATKPRWELLVDSQVKYTDGFNLDVPEGHKLIVSSLPNEQRAVLVDPDGHESNVYQQQILSYTNFIRIPPGLSILMVYGSKGQVDFKYREERDVV